LLVKRSLARAVAGVIKDSLGTSPHKLTTVTAEDAIQLDAQLAMESVELSTDFFKHPARARVVGTVARLLASWLRSAGQSTEDADAAVLTLPPRFVAEMNTELTEKKELYERIVKDYAPRFAQAAEAEDAWLKYHIELHTSANPPVLNLGVSLEQVYVELRAYTEPPVESMGRATSKQSKHRSDAAHTPGVLTDLAQVWVEQEEDAIFVLSGGPGAGKSAFARRFAAWRAWSGRRVPASNLL